jgi:hypothetical protein
MLSTCSPETACGILADEAFADLLQKHGRPVDLKTLRQSVDEIEKRPPAPSMRRQDPSRKSHKGE